jgi:DNA-directed RNA polymerase specialized sigma24 family protein
MTFIPDNKILQAITELYEAGKLDSRLVPEMLPALAEALAPTVNRYWPEEQRFPEPEIFLPMIRNFIQDGPLVQALLAIDSPEGSRVWGQLREKLRQKTRQKWSWLATVDQEAIVDAAYDRARRYLPTFMFLSRLSTWIERILVREYLRRKPRIEVEQKILVSIDKEVAKGLTPVELIASAETGAEEVVEHEQVIQALKQRIARLGAEPDVKILLLHLSGYTLEEIKKKLSQEQIFLSVPTIKRRKDRLISHLGADPFIKEIARQLGILEAEQDEKK